MPYHLAIAQFYNCKSYYTDIFLIRQALFHKNFFNRYLTRLSSDFADSDTILFLQEEFRRPKAVFRTASANKCAGYRSDKNGEQK